MKKLVLSLFSIMLVSAMLFSTTSTAAALPPPPTTPDLPEPVVTPVSGDMEFTTEFIPIAQFPGTTEFNQMLVPVGFPAGEAQYEGDGVVVSGMDTGTATACFYITGTEYGWGGKVGLWDGTKWIKLVTTITPVEESNKSLACAPITGNGTYAFIRYVVDASLLPAYNPCPVDTSGWSLLTWSNSEGPYFYVHFVNLPYGTPATLTFINADPLVNYGGFTGTSNATVDNLFPGDADFYDSHFAVFGAVVVTMRVTAAGCSVILQIPLAQGQG